MKLKSQKKRAMTIIEILISIALIAILLVPIANVVISSSNTSKKAEAKQQGALLGQNILEEIKAIDEDEKIEDYSLLNYSEPGDDKIKFKTPGEVSYDAKEKKDYSIRVITEKVDGYSYDRTESEKTTGPKWNAESEGKFAHTIRLAYKNDNSGKVIITNLSGTLGVDLDQTNLILEVENGMKSVFYKNSGSKDDPAKGEMICEINSPNSAKNKILINIAAKDVAIAIINNSGKSLEFEVTKDGYEYNNANVYASREKTENDTIITNYVAKMTEDEMDETKIGDLYKITVEVEYGKGSDKDVVFTASTTKNVKVIK